MATDRITRALRIGKLAHALGEYDTNVLGMIGEIVAEDVLGMTKSPKQSKDIDGHIQVGNKVQSVQVKALSSSRIARYGRSAKFRIASGLDPEILVVLLVITKTASYKVLHNGPAQSVGKLETVSGVQRRGIKVADLFTGREQELKEVLAECRSFHPESPQIQ